MKIHEMYKEVFDAIDCLKLHDDVDNYITDLLVELHFPELDDKNLNENYEKVRKSIEYIFRKMIELGIAMQLPKGFVAKVRQRSSTTKNLKLVMATSGFIDNCYNGDTDEWKFYCYAIDKTSIHKGDRICQFEVCLSQYATIWQKIKWMFTKKIEFKFVGHLNNVS